MAGYRYTPDWNQHAQRDTDLVDPVVVVRQLSRFEFTLFTSRRPTSQVDHALVFSDGRGKYAAFVPPIRPTRGELAKGRYVSVHEVDMGIHHLSFEVRLPSDNEAFFFDGQVDVNWRVSAPERVVARGVRDVPAVVTPALGRQLRTVTRRFSIEHSREAEEAVHDELEYRPPVQSYGLAVSCAVRLELDAQAKEHRTQLRAVGYQTERLRPEFELARQQQEYQHQLEAAREQHQQWMVERRAAFYRYHLERGGVAAWAMQLAEHPGDIVEAARALDADQQRQITSQLGLIDQLVESKHFEAHQLEDATVQTLRVIRDHFAALGRSAAPPPAHPVDEALPAPAIAPAAEPELFPEPEPRRDGTPSSPRPPQPPPSS